MTIRDSVLPNTSAPTTNNSGITHNVPLKSSDRFSHRWRIRASRHPREGTHRRSPVPIDSPLPENPRPATARHLLERVVERVGL
jgi:hypothetical protein